MRRDPLLVLTALLAGLTGGALGATGEVPIFAFAIPAASLVCIRWPATAPRGKRFEIIFQLIALGFLGYFVVAVSNGRLLAAAVSASVPVQIHALLSQPTHGFLRRLHVLSFFQLLALAASTTRILFGPLLVAHLVLAPLVLTLAALERAQGEPRRPLPWPRRAHGPMGGLVGPAVGAAAACLVLGIVGFLALPRYEYGLLTMLSQPTQRISGFSDRVALGDITRILSSDKVAMRVTLGGARPDDLRWRGKTFDKFSGREWTVTRAGKIAPRGPGGSRVGESHAGGRRVVQEFALEPLQARALFHVGHPTLVTPETFGGVLVDAWGNLARSGEGSRRVRYRVVSELGGDGGDLSEEHRAAFLQLPPLDARIGELALTTAGEGSEAIRAARVEKSLQDGWPYTLEVNDVGVESPVERFLLEQTGGPCEYFATGMVLLLREIGIPARLVTGFGPGTYSRLFGAYVVRQRDAHAWVEAWIPGRGWTTFDPTPPEGREVAGDSDATEIWRRAEMLWDDNVIGFNYTFQLGFLIGARETLDQLVASVSRTTIAASFAGLALIAVLVVLLRRGRRAVSAPRRTELAFFARAQRTLERAGWRREPGQTPLEVARLAAIETGAPGEAAVELTRIYYAARFGGHSADAGRVRALLEQLAGLPTRRAVH